MVLATPLVLVEKYARLENVSVQLVCLHAMGYVSILKSIDYTVVPVTMLAHQGESAPMVPACYRVLPPHLQSVVVVVSTL